MRRHAPSLFSHPELGPNEDGDDEEKRQWNSRQSPYMTPSTSSGRRSRFRDGYSTITPSTMPASSSDPRFPKYSDIYSQFLRRYRSEPGEGDRHDPDSRLGQLTDNGDSDDDELGHLANGPSMETIDRFSSMMLETELNGPTTLEDRERLEWQTMLASVLEGDVLKGEKTRIAVALQTFAEEKDNRHMNLWLGIRAKLRGRSIEEERKRLEERRLRTIEDAIAEMLTFRVIDYDTHDAASRQVNAVLQKLDAAHSLYPNLKSFYTDNPAATERDFQARCDTLNTWSTVLSSLRNQINLLRKWTGSETLDVLQPNTNAEVPIRSDPFRLSLPKGTQELADESTFVERVLKEDSIQRTFEKGFLTTVHALIGTARDAQVNLAPLFKEMNLPTFEAELVQLISFPTKLVEASLRVRLDHALKVKDPELLLIDQLTEDFRLLIGFACTLKRQYEAFLTPDPGGNWDLPACISKDYDSVILEALGFFFRLIHWKLKSGAKGIHLKETGVLEAQWATFNDVSLSIAGGASFVAEQICALTNKLIVRETNYFDTQVKAPILQDKGAERKVHQTRVDGLGFDYSARLHESSSRTMKMSEEQKVNWYGKLLENVRLRYRKLQRFSRVLAQRFSNSSEYTLEDASLDHFIATLVETDHFLVYTQTFEEEGTYIIAPPVLRDRPDAIRKILQEAFHVNELWMSEYRDDAGPKDPLDAGAEAEDEYDNYGYLLVLSPRNRFLWNGLVLILEIPKIDLDLKDNRVRLIADGNQQRLAVAKERFGEVFIPIYDDGHGVEPQMMPLTCVTELQAHLPAVNRELRKIARATNRLAETIMDSVENVRQALQGVTGCQELLENWYGFASEHGQHAQKHADRATWSKFNQLLIKLAISWVSFICDDCDPTDRKTFRWAVHALEFTLHRTKRNNILHLPEDQFEMLRQKVASCMTLLISHFDILGARSTLEAKKERERQEEILRQQTMDARYSLDHEDTLSPASDYDDITTSADQFSASDRSIRIFRDEATRALQVLDDQRALVASEQRIMGRVLDDEKPEDRSLVFLASSSSNISIRWQQGRFIGAGAFGSVYTAVNLDSGSLMAVKEIKFQELSGMPNLYSQIKDELSVMEMLHHPNVVEYYGIEVHRDKVYIFEEYCQGGSLAALLELGRIEDESIIQLYTMQMLEGLAYLHFKGIVHRDIKPDNILLDHLGVIKFGDFGAAKILARNRTIQRSRVGAYSMTNGTPSLVPSPAGGLGGGLGLNNSLTGTPMYMAPEVIKNDNRGRHGAMDIWSMGCVVLEFATGKKPWSNLDNEWAIMFHIGVATQHPPLPEPGQLTEVGINFIKQCLTIDPMRRPTAVTLMDHPWMIECREALMGYEAQELATSPPAHVPPEEPYEMATVARPAAILQEKEVESITAASPVTSEMATPPTEESPSTYSQIEWTNP